MPGSLIQVLLSMSPRLRQINVSYVDLEDRLLLRVSTSDDQEYRLWCTRRFTRLLLDRFEDLFQREVAATVAVTPPARRDVAQMQHSLAVSEESFSKPYQAQPTGFPLGKKGLLVTTLRYKKSDQGGLQFQLTDGGDKGMALVLSESLQHQFYELFGRAAQKAKWFVATTGSSPGSPRADTVVH